jgi:hypothetical protein
MWAKGKEGGLMKKFLRLINKTFEEMGTRQFYWLLPMHILGYLLTILAFQYDLHDRFSLGLVLGLTISGSGLFLNCGSCPKSASPSCT